MIKICGILARAIFSSNQKCANNKIYKVKNLFKLLIKHFSLFWHFFKYIYMPAALKLLKYAHVYNMYLFVECLNFLIAFRKQF